MLLKGLIIGLTIGCIVAMAIAEWWYRKTIRILDDVDSTMDWFQEELERVEVLLHDERMKRLDEVQPKSPSVGAGADGTGRLLFSEPSETRTGCSGGAYTDRSTSADPCCDLRPGTGA